MLDHLFAMQAELNRYTMAQNGQVTPESIPADRGLQERWVQNYIRAMQQELAEALDHTNWKWWRTKVDQFDPQALKVELIDVLHFWISACQAMGLTADDVVRIYTEKNKVNLERQRTGYLVKDKNDSRHIQ